MRCLVTGAAGFLGSRLLVQLLKDGHAVTILLRPNSNPWRIEHLLTQVEVIRCDLTERDSIGDHLKAARPEVVYHLAWAGGSSGKYQNTLTQIEDNIPSSLTLFKAAAEAGARRWVGCGSAAEYGKVEGTAAEMAAPQPYTLYGIGKYALCLTTAKLSALLGLEYLWARPFGVYGPQDHPNGLIPFVVRSLLEGKRPSLTAGEQRWDYLYVEDAARALACLASVPVEGVFNVASGDSSTLRSLVERIRDLIDPRLPLGFGEIAYPPDQLMNLCADISKLKREAGWSPQVSLADGIKQVIEEMHRKINSRQQ